LPQLAITGAKAGSTNDLELIRQTLREALGDPRGTTGAVFGVPTPLSTWIAMPPSTSAVEDCGAWQNALEEAWGKRRFVDYPVRAMGVYG
jgi:hypothetical protein